MHAPPPGFPEREWITVVTGLPRSGTSLMMQMLDAAGWPVMTDDERPADTDNPRGYLELAAVKRLPSENDWLPKAMGRALKVVTPLLVHLPAGLAYRIVWMHRDLDEVLASQRAMLARRGAVDDLEATPALARALESGTHQARLAFERRDVPILDVRFADAIADPPAVARALDRFLGGGLDVSAAASRVDVSLHRARGS